MFKKAMTVALAVLIVVVIWFVQLLWSAGQFKTIEPHFDGTCKQIPGLSGAEDIAIHPRTGIAYISACDRRAVNAGGHGEGAIYAYNLNVSNPVLFNLTSDMQNDFQPHGISLYVGGSGPDFLFAINHADNRHTIEVFELVGIVLYHTKTISDPMLVSPNDLVAVGPDSFYVSNDHGHVSGIMRVMEEYLKLRLSNVVYYDGSRFSEAAGGIGYANGIQVSQDGKTLYLCAVTELSLHLYDRELPSGKLSLREKIKLDTGADNIEVDSSGGLWIGAHPQLLKFVAHANDPSNLSPSQILYLSPTPSGGFDIKEVYLNKGDELSAASVAAVRGQRMLIGSVFDPKFLDCQLE